MHFKADDNEDDGAKEKTEIKNDWHAFENTFVQGFFPTNINSTVNSNDLISQLLECSDDEIFDSSLHKLVELGNEKSGKFSHCITESEENYQMFCESSSKPVSHTDSPTSKKDLNPLPKKRYTKHEVKTKSKKNVQKKKSSAATVSVNSSKESKQKKVTRTVITETIFNGSIADNVKTRVRRSKGESSYASADIPIHQRAIPDSKLNKNRIAKKTTPCSSRGSFEVKDSNSSDVPAPKPSLFVVCEQMDTTRLKMSVKRKKKRVLNTDSSVASNLTDQLRPQKNPSVVLTKAEQDKTDAEKLHLLQVIKQEPDTDCSPMQSNSYFPPLYNASSVDSFTSMSFGDDDSSTPAYYTDITKNTALILPSARLDNWTSIFSVLKKEEEDKQAQADAPVPTKRKLRGIEEYKAHKARCKLLGTNDKKTVSSVSNYNETTLSSPAYTKVKVENEDPMSPVTYPHTDEDLLANNFVSFCSPVRSCVSIDLPPNFCFDQWYSSNEDDRHILNPAEKSAIPYESSPVWLFSEPGPSQTRGFVDRSSHTSQCIPTIEPSSSAGYPDVKHGPSTPPYSPASSPQREVNAQVENIEPSTNITKTVPQTSSQLLLSVQSVRKHRSKHRKHSVSSSYNSETLSSSCERPSRYNSSPSFKRRLRKSRNGSRSYRYSRRRSSSSRYRKRRHYSRSKSRSYSRYSSSSDDDFTYDIYKNAEEIAKKSSSASPEKRREKFHSKRQEHSAKKHSYASRRSSRSTYHYTSSDRQKYSPSPHRRHNRTYRKYSSSSRSGNSCSRRHGSTSTSRSRSRSVDRISKKYSSSRRRHVSWREQQKQIDERRVVYVGLIPDSYTKSMLENRFASFGRIVDVRIHNRMTRRNDNFGFVTFKEKSDAYNAVEYGNEAPLEPKFEISFGGRKGFCKQEYSDLDKENEIKEICDLPPSSQADISFDSLLKAEQQRVRSQNKKY